MRKYLVTAVLCAMSGSAFGASLDYTITPRWNGETRHLEVSLSFEAKERTKTRLNLPNRWGGEENLYEGIRNLSARSRSTRIRSTDKPHLLEVEHPAGAPVTINYEVIQDWDRPLTKDDYYRPILEENYFHFIGYGVFAFPDLGDDEIAVHLSWNGIPADWNLANSFASETMEQRFHVSKISDLLHAVYTGGDLDLRTFEIEGRPLHVAVRGQWRFSVEHFYEIARTVFKTGRDFWSDHDFPYFLITMIPTDAQGHSMGGTGLTDSFALFIGHQLEDAEEFEFLLAHELFHTWNGRKIGRERPEALVYWFSEGFTNYYTRLLNLRAGLIDLPEYAASYNNVLRKYYISPVRNETHERVLEDFWDHRAVEKLPYQRGDIMAHAWNRKIKANGTDGALDDFMFDLLDAAEENGTVVSPESLDRLIRPYIADGVREHISRHVERGKTIRPRPGALGPCFSLEHYPTERFDLGFEYAKSATVVRGVDPDSNAYEAGLRNGHTLLDEEIAWWRTEKYVRFKVQHEDGRESWIEFRPQGQTTDVPRYQLDERRYRENPQECRAWFEE